MAEKVYLGFFKLFHETGSVLRQITKLDQADERNGYGEYLLILVRGNKET